MVVQNSKLSAFTPLTGGKAYVVQIDESLFRGRRKYNVGILKNVVMS